MRAKRQRKSFIQPFIHPTIQTLERMDIQTAKRIGTAGYLHSPGYSPVRQEIRLHARLPLSARLRKKRFTLFTVLIYKEKAKRCTAITQPLHLIPVSYIYEHLSEVMRMPYPIKRYGRKDKESHSFKHSNVWTFRPRNKSA